MSTPRGSETALELIGQYDVNRQTAAALSCELTRDQLWWRPGDAWCVAECFDHLARTNTLIGSAMARAVAQPTPPRWHEGFPVPAALDNWMVRAIEPPVRIRFTAPPAARPMSDGADEDMLAKYFDSHRALLAVLELPWARIERIRFRHPVRWLSLSLVSGLRLMAAHDRRHLWQAARVVALQQGVRAV